MPRFVVFLIVCLVLGAAAYFGIWQVMLYNAQKEVQKQTNEYIQESTNQRDKDNKEMEEQGFRKDATPKDIEDSAKKLSGVRPSEGAAPKAKPAEDKPADKPAEEKPADKPAEEKPADKPAEEKPAEGSGGN